jgi:hypothetical protein
MQLGENILLKNAGTERSSNKINKNSSGVGIGAEFYGSRFETSFSTTIKVSYGSDRYGTVRNEDCEYR